MKKSVVAAAVCGLPATGCAGLNICGELFQPGPYKEGLQKGLARRPRPPV